VFEPGRYKSIFHDTSTQFCLQETHLGSQDFLSLVEFGDWLLVKSVVHAVRAYSMGQHPLDMLAQPLSVSMAESLYRERTV